MADDVLNRYICVLPSTFKQYGTIGQQSDYHYNKELTMVFLSEDWVRTPPHYLVKNVSSFSSVIRCVELPRVISKELNSWSNRGVWVSLYEISPGHKTRY